MLYLLFSTQDQRYALQAEHIIEVIPNIIEPKSQQKLTARHLPVAQNTHVSFIGYITYYDGLIPVVDLCLLKTAKACRKLISSRIILIHYPSKNGPNSPLGLLCEKVSETIQVGINDKGSIKSHRGLDFLVVEQKSAREEVEILERADLLPDSLNIFNLI